MTYTGEWLNKLLYTAIFKNEDDLCELIWSNFQDILLNEKSKAQKSIANMLLFLQERREYNKHVLDDLYKRHT